MATELVTHDDALAHAALKEAVERTYKAIEKDPRTGKETLPALPVGVIREQMRERLKSLRPFLRPISMAMAERDCAVRIVGQLLAAYPNMYGDPVGLVNSYVEHLLEVPLFAIRMAVDDFKHRRVFDMVD